MIIYSLCFIIIIGSVTVSESFYSIGITHLILQTLLHKESEYFFDLKAKTALHLIDTID
jgi:hypothetical protein